MIVTKAPLRSRATRSESNKFLRISVHPMRRCNHRQDDDEAKAAMNIIGMFECVGKIGATIMLALISFR
jgi:hypothetical protein